MSGMSHTRAQQTLERLCTTQPPRHQLAALREHLALCPDCASAYRRCLSLEARLCQSPDGLTPFRAERIWQAVQAKTSTSKRHSFWQLGALGSLLAAATVALFVALLPQSERVDIPPSLRLAPVPVQGELTVRGNESQPLESVGVRMFRAVAAGERVEEVTHLSVDDTVTFTYTSAAPDLRHLALFGVQENGSLRWYYPDYGEKRSIVIKPDLVDEPLGHGIILRVNHTAGPLRVVALFSSQPLLATDLEAAFSNSVRAARESIPVALQHGAGVVMHSFTVGVQAE
ncbi:hypothetical protein ACFL6C_14730 [Myxococcota bacterium]